jgi:hypothetical protein
LFRRKFTLLIIAFASVAVSSEEADNENTLKCLVGHLKSRNVHEDFFDGISTKFNSPVDCPSLINSKLDHAYTKIETKLKSDVNFSKYANCVMPILKQNDENTIIMLRREAIKLNGLGIQIWNYFNQKEYLDKLKKQVENNINNIASQRCINAR